MKTLEYFPQLAKLNDAFIKGLWDYTINYSKGIVDSPVWLQYRPIENRNMVFDSSQNSRSGFSIYLPDLLSDEEIEELVFAPYKELYEYFKELKYNYLESLNCGFKRVQPFTK